MFCSHESHQGKFAEITAHRQSELNLSGISKCESINSNHNIYLISNPIGSTMVATMGMATIRSFWSHSINPAPAKTTKKATGDYQV